MKRRHAQIVSSLIFSSMIWATAQAEEAISPTAVFSEISRKTVDLGDRRITYVRIRPPLFPSLSAKPAAAAVPIVSAEAQVALDELGAKDFVDLGVGANVYYGENQRPVTELRWHDEQGLQYIAWSSADFRYLSQLRNFESSTTVYQWFPMVTPLEFVDPREKAPVPDGLALRLTDVEYHVCFEAKDDASQEKVLDGLDLIHAYYQLHYKELKAAYEELQARIAEDERLRILNPPAPKDATIRFWKIAAPSSVTNK